MVKTLIYSLPPLDRDRPPLSAAILASICEQQGHAVEVVDLQKELDQYLETNNISPSFFDDVFYEQSPGFSDQQAQCLAPFVQQQIERFRDQQPDYILISFFTFLAQNFGDLFLPQLRKATASKIVIGGAGIVRTSEIEIEPYALRLKNKGFIDEFIIGEAEESLIKYFKGESGLGIGNYNIQQVENLDQHPWPNYGYFDLDRYRVNQKGLTIIGSRGCVRNCTFCDIRATTPKYKFRSGKNIADEIIHHYETQGVTKFYFADSLVNGSFKAFDDMCNGIIRYNFPEPISWSGQYIIRSQKTTPKITLTC